jgi:hypothetical protein
VGDPFDTTPLEIIADDAGIGPDELRDYLRAEIERRRSGTAVVRGSECSILADDRRSS